MGDVLSDLERAALEDVSFSSAAAYLVANAT